ncbi:MAG TPA: EAL domain-containing protein, partial [Vicinamibacteria bacterium]|nr:EAL domain-containing protein [Vicinamibacteria bacterium]
GVEALLRWGNPGAEDDDITNLLLHAERSPVIFKIENWTLAEGFRAAAAWKEAGLAGLRVSVNLSAREFLRADLVRRVRRQITGAGLAPGDVGLEITETSRMFEFAAVADQLERLSEMGIEMWLDDFGTGHSSLEWLIRLPVHGVKIPGAFVEKLFTEKRCPIIVGRVIDLAHDLGLEVIAEGVETAEQRDFLAARGCDIIQGFLFYAALPAADLPAALARTAEPARS